MKKPVVRSRSGRICRQRRSGGRRAPGRARRGPRSRAAAASARPRPRAAPRPGPRSRGGRSCRSRRRGFRRAAATRRRGRGSRPGPRPGARSPAGVLRQRASGREARAPRSEQGASTRTRSNPAAIAPAAASASTTVTVRSPSRPAWAATSAARAGSSSTEIVSPRSPIRSAIWPVLIPGPAQRSRTCSPGWGSRTSTTAAEPRLCGVSSPAAIRASAASPILPSRTSISGAASGHSPAAGRRRPLPRASAASGLVAAARGADAQGDLGRLVAGGEQRPRAPRARAPPTTSAPARAAPSGRPRRAPGSSRRRAARR